MLEVLRIRNVAIIDIAEVHFKSGLNIISGETGAGKSILIEAISLLLGSRASTELIRSGCEEAVVEGVFNISEIGWMGSRLKQCGFEESPSELLIKRTVHKGGKHRISINGELATLSTLQNICEGLIDLCGQHEHQSLLKPTTQLELLDRYGGLTQQARSVAGAWQKTRGLQKEHEELKNTENERIKRSDFLKFQIDEINAASLDPEEEPRLQQKKQLMQSAELRVQAADAVAHILENEEAGALNILRAALLKLRPLYQLDPSVESQLAALERALAETEEVALFLHRYPSSVEFDSEQLQSLQDRLSFLANLRRKYNTNIQGVLDNLGELEREYHSLENVSEKILEVSKALEIAEKELTKLVKKLSSGRKKVSELLSDSVTGELKDLKMGGARFQVEIVVKDHLADWTASGCDNIQFLVQTNKGEPCRPLGKIASGGELSRLMLAIRRVIADRGGIGVYLFDEIDSGIGGQTAFQVGKKLKSVSSYNQVICITHLPQVASFADHHLVVRKSVTGRRTLTEIAELKAKERKEELARMLGGPELTRKSLENASELLEMALKQ